MGRKKAIFLCRLLSISKNTICISKLFVDFRIIACRTIERQPDNCIKRDCHWQWVWIRRVVWYAVKWNHSLLSSGRSGSDWRISWRRVVAPAGDWFFRLPGHAHSNQINVCLICPSISFIIINLCWSPRAIRFGSQYPTAANRSPGSGFCRGLLAFHSFGVWLPGGNRLYVRGRLLSSVALTPGDFAYFSRFKSMGAKRMFSALVHNVACQWTTEINVV